MRDLKTIDKIIEDKKAKIKDLKEQLKKEEDELKAMEKDFDGEIESRLPKDFDGYYEDNECIVSEKVTNKETLKIAEILTDKNVRELLLASFNGGRCNVSITKPFIKELNGLSNKANFVKSEAEVSRKVVLK